MAYREALSAAQELGDSHNVAYALSSLGMMSFETEDYDAAAAYCDQGIAIARERGLRRNLANMLTRAARVAAAAGNLPRAHRLLGEASMIAWVSAEAEFWCRQFHEEIIDWGHGRGASVNSRR